MALTSVVAVSTAVLLITAVGAAALLLFWATAALERWLDTTQSPEALLRPLVEADPVDSERT